MKDIGTILFLTAFIVSCNTATDPSVKRKDYVHNNQQEAENENNEDQHLTSLLASVECKELCEDKNLPMALVEEHLGKTFYNKRITSDEKETQVRFDFISDCCQSFLGKHEERNDTLFLFYYPDSSGVKCDCYCDYRMTYSFDNNNQAKNDWKRIVIKRVF